jgi:uncharacterized protein (DUF433 family)
MSYPPNDGPWIKYIDENARPGRPVIRDSGHPVWAIIGHYKLYEGDKEQVLSDYMGELTAEELNAALAYYRDHPEPTDRKLWEISFDDSLPPDLEYSSEDVPDIPDPPKDFPWQKYIDDEGTRSSKAALRDSGYPVWAVIGYFDLYNGDKEKVLAEYRGALTAEELDAALAYYRDNPGAIDRILYGIPR